MAHYASQAFLSKKNLNPKTILGFYASILVIVLTGCLVMAGVLSGSPTLAWLVPWGILFGGLMTIVIVAGVSYFVLKDPSRLMLTEVSGSEYRAIQQDAYLGDSKMGLRRIGHESTESLAIEPLKIVEESIVVKLGGQDD